MRTDFKWIRSRGFRLAILFVLIGEMLWWSEYSPRHSPILGARLRHDRPGRAIVTSDGDKLSVVWLVPFELAEGGWRPPWWDSAVAACSFEPYSSGLLSPTNVEYNHRVVLFSRATTLHPGLTRSEVVAALQRDPKWPAVTSSRYSYLLTSGDGTTNTIHRGWVMHDMVIAGLMLAGLVSWYYGSVRPANARRRLERSAANLALHICPSCAYSITGLPAGPVAKCPECGRVLSAEADGPDACARRDDDAEQP